KKTTKLEYPLVVPKPDYVTKMYDTIADTTSASLVERLITMANEIVGLLDIKSNINMFKFLSRLGVYQALVDDMREENKMVWNRPFAMKDDELDAEIQNLVNFDRLYTAIAGLKMLDRGDTTYDSARGDIMHVSLLA